MDSCVKLSLPSFKREADTSFKFGQLASDGDWTVLQRIRGRENVIKVTCHDRKWVIKLP